MKRILFSLTIVFLLMLGSCGLKPIPSEYGFIKTDISEPILDNLGNGKVLIYNGASFPFKIDDTSRLNIWIEGKPLGQLRKREYVVIKVKEGEYNFKLHHLDLVKMKSGHKIIITDTTRVIKVQPTLTSNKLTITDTLPKRFEKYRYAPKR